MTVWIYGDLALDNYEYELPKDFTKTYKRLLDVDLPDPRFHIPNRFVARKFGGAHLIARHLAVAIALWNEDLARDQAGRRGNSTTRSLEELCPWKEYRSLLLDLEEKLARNPAEFDDILQFFYRVSRDSDNAYRMQPQGYEGYTLPLRAKRGQKQLFPLLGASGPHFADPIKLDDGYGNDANLLVFNDGGTRLRREDPNWLTSQLRAINCERTWAVLKSHEPAPKGKPSPLFEKLYDLLPGRVILVLNAKELRRNGLAISKSLSWETSIRDLVERIHEIPNRATLVPDLPRHVIITFDYDAALYLAISESQDEYRHLEISEARTEYVAISTSRKNVEKAILVFSTDRSEGEYRSRFRGSMPGAQSLFTAVLAGLIYKHMSNSGPSSELSDNLIKKVLTYALIAKQKMLNYGFEPVSSKMLRRPGDFQDNDDDIRKDKRLMADLEYHEAMFALPPRPRPKKDEQSAGREPTPWMPSSAPEEFDYPLGRGGGEELLQLHKDQSDYGLAEVVLDEAWLNEPAKEFFDVFAERLSRWKQFVNYVRNESIKDPNGSIGDNETRVPIATIGQIKTVSSGEIESLRAVRRLTDSYLAAERDISAKPLGIAVFGQPGTGKSFTVRSVFKTLKGLSRELTEESFIECNLSGLKGPEDISSVFQRARDLRLEGKVPVIFFDEFDCTVGTVHFFWLKHFLAPLQDGVFRSEDATHPIGKSIFVFAGSVTPKFDAFVERIEKEPKGPDFLGRLQGHINVEGISPTDRDGKLPEDLDFLRDTNLRKYVMRRAIVLRELLMKRARSIVKAGDEAKAASIDKNVVEAFLRDIDENVVEAFLKEGKYRYGIRSIEAVIRMSSVGPESRFTPECLPTREQLQMHVSEKFYDRAFGKEPNAPQ